MKDWDELPPELRCDELRPYYDILRRHRGGLTAKRGFDIAASALLLAALSPVLLAVSAAVAADSRGGVFFLQERVTAYARHFKIIKFRTMVPDAESLGSQLTTSGDMRVTRVGRFLRKSRLDELPQLVNILVGDMSFVGTRPEVPRYVARYTNEMLATLLLPAGVTSEASIRYKDEYKLLTGAESIDDAYVQKVLPGKMYYNLKAIEDFSILNELRTMLRTVLAVCGKEYK
ncbi:MAG: sugar transferase [Oscillospiraceae bacterium]|nr:sugar transferase [Oscillospiraceae bacterium]